MKRLIDDSDDGALLLSRPGTQGYGPVESAFMSGPGGGATGRSEAADLIDASSLHAAMQEQALRNPGACALVFLGRRFSYEWLEDRAEQLAGFLIDSGVKPCDLVGIYMERSPDMVAAIFAILKAGAAYLPLDPEQPDPRLEAILADAAPAAVLSEATLDGRLATGNVLRLRCDSVPRTLSARVRPEVGRQDLAYVLYTSGSTGRPKGVEIPHGAVLNLISSFLRTPGFTGRDRVLGATTTAFDISVLEIFLPLAAGATLVLADQPTMRDPQALGALIDASRCTFAQATPSKWRYLVDAGWNGAAGLTIMCGGEALTRELADRLLVRGAAVWNVYGPTETTVWSTMARVTHEAGAPPIGWPVANTTLHILDGQGEAVDGDDVGELHIGGLGLARGYHNRPELTRERFVHLDGERVYRTGDLVRRRADGALECLGRTDHQVKVRGFRVELGEVETALLGCGGVRWSAVRTFLQEDGDTALAAYLVPCEDGPTDPAVLRRALARRLPGYMIPSRIVFMDALPMTAGGKIDRNALPAPDPRVCAETAGTVPEAMSETQSRLAGIWADVLGLSSVSPSDNFFDLGGYSLLTLKLLRRVQDVFGRTLTMAQLFAATDLAAMARLLDDPGAPAPSHIPLQPLGDRPPLIWFDVGPQLRGLAERMAPDQPILGLNLEPNDEALAPGRLCAARVGEQLVRLLKALQPRGPYYLGGWCRWGVMAYAAAERLLDGGDEVRLLVLLDAVNSASPYQTLRRTTRKSVDILTRRTPSPPPATAGLGGPVDVAARRYKPPLYRGDVLLLRAADAERDWDDCSGWRDVVRGGLEVCDLPGDHTGILKPPHVGALAETLSARLLKAQRALAP